MRVTGQYRRAILLSQKAFQIRKWTGRYYELFSRWSGNGFVHLNNNENDSARIKIEKSNVLPPELYKLRRIFGPSYIDGSIKLEIQPVESCFNRFFERNQVCCKRRIMLVGIALTYILPVIFHMVTQLSYTTIDTIIRTINGDTACPRALARYTLSVRQ